MNHDKLNFIQHTFPELVKKLNGSEVPLWGKMNAQQMIEHISDSIRIADEKNKHELHTAPEQLPVYRKFMLSDKEFKPNTKNALMDEDPVPVTKSSLAEAIREMEAEIADFIAFFKTDPERKTTNPFFGTMNFEEWIHLLYKHLMHHAKQFGLL
jgi:hypothetical protein